MGALGIWRSIHATLLHVRGPFSLCRCHGPWWVGDASTQVRWMSFLRDGHVAAQVRGSSFVSSFDPWFDRIPSFLLVHVASMHLGPKVSHVPCGLQVCPSLCGMESRTTLDVPHLFLDHTIVLPNPGRDLPFERHGSWVRVGGTPGFGSHVHTSNGAHSWKVSF